MNTAQSSVSEAVLRKGLGVTVETTHFDSLGRRFEGKVRDNYTSGDRRWIVVTDRVSAFDRPVGTLPFKGQVLNAMTHYWFEHTQHIAPNHVRRWVDPNIMEVLECTPLLVEMVVRAYLTGVTSTSIWTHYARGERVFCGHRLPDGMRQNQELERPLVTPSTKAQKGAHDKSMSREDILALGQVSAEDFDAAEKLSLALFTEGQKMCAERGLILVDTKYEFGKTPQGQLVLIDEIHTPDSSRYWYSDSYEEHFAQGEPPESLDKEYLRRFLAAEGFLGDGPVPIIPEAVRLEAARRYIASYELITGLRFEPNLEPPLERMAKNLAIAR